MLSSKVIFTERDLAPFFIPPKMLWVSQLKNLQFPFWNPHNYCGIPLLATLQPGIFYPPHIFYLVFPFNIVWNWLVILHFVFAAATMYAFLRFMKVSHPGSTVGGAVFMLAGYLLSVHNLLPHLFGVAWFPLILLYFLKYFESERQRHLVLASIFLVIQFLAGAPEIVILTGIVLVITIFFLGAILDKDIPLRSRVKGLVLLGVIVVLLSGIQLTAFYELHRYSIRSAGLSYASATTWSFAWKDFIQFFLPDFFGYQQTIEKYWLNQSWLKTLYLGIGPLLFSVLFFAKGGRTRWFFLGLVVFSLVLGLGGNTPVYKLLHKIPPFNSVRYPVKFLFLLFFALSAMTAMGLDILRKGIAYKDRTVRRIVLVFFYSGFLCALGWAFLNFRYNEITAFLEHRNIRPPLFNDIWFNLHNAKRFLLFSFVLCTGIFLYLELRAKRIVLGFIAAVLVADLFLANYGFYGSASWRWFKTPDAFAKVLADNRETERFMVSVKTEDDLNSILLGKDLLVAPYAAVHGLYGIGGAEVMRIDHQDKYLRLFNCVKNIREARNLLDIGGVKYAILSYPVENDQFRLVKKEALNDKEVYLYEYRGYPGRFLFFSNARYFTDDNEVMLRIIDQGFDLKRELIISGQPRPGLARNPRAKGAVTLVSYEPAKVVLTSRCEGNGFLYIGDTWYPGWRAYVDGRRTKVYRANLAFRAIEVPAGEHTVVFAYVPISFYAGCILTVFGMILSTWLWRKGPKIRDPILKNEKLL